MDVGNPRGLFVYAHRELISAKPLKRKMKYKHALVTVVIVIITFVLLLFYNIIIIHVDKHYSDFGWYAL